MKTDPTAGIAGVAGTPLSHQAIESGSRSAANIRLKSKHSTAISDTVETSDREADGRLSQDSPQTNSDSHKATDDSGTGDRLDLTA